MKLIPRAAVCVYDGGPLSPVFPSAPFKPDAETAEYLAALADKLASPESARRTAFAPGSAQAEPIRRFSSAPFMEATGALFAAMDEAMQTLELAREGFDLVVFSFEEDGAARLCVAYLPYHRAVVHETEEADGGALTRLAARVCALPAPGAKGCAGFVCDLSGGDVRLRDVTVQTNVGPRGLFGEALFALEATRTEKQAVRAVETAIAEAAPDVPQSTLRPAVKRAMERSIEEKGVIDVADVADEVFRSDPEREALIRQVEKRLEEEAVEPRIPVESRSEMRRLQRVKLRTDSGISITLPRELADDEKRFAVVENADGTLSIVIGGVQELKTE